MEQKLIEFTSYISSAHPVLAYIFFFISAALQILFPPYPGDTVLIFEGYLSSRGYFNTFLILLNAIISTYISCLLLYHLSLYLGDRIFEIGFINKFFPREKQSKLTNWFKKYGPSAILISKFVPGVGSLTMIVAGTFKVPKAKAYGAMGAATLVHNSFLVFAGKLMGDNMELIKDLIRKYNLIIVSIVVLIIAIYIYKRSVAK